MRTPFLKQTNLGEVLRSIEPFLEAVEGINVFVSGRLYFLGEDGKEQTYEVNPQNEFIHMARLLSKCEVHTMGGNLQGMLYFYTPGRNNIGFHDFIISDSLKGLHADDGYLIVDTPDELEKYLQARYKEYSENKFK